MVQSDVECIKPNSLKPRPSINLSRLVFSPQHFVQFYVCMNIIIFMIKLVLVVVSGVLGLHVVIVVDQEIK